MERILTDIFHKVITDISNEYGITSDIPMPDIVSSMYSDYQFNAFLKLYHFVKRFRANLTADNYFSVLKDKIMLKYSNIISNFELVSGKFINITVNNDFLLDKLFNIDDNENTKQPNGEKIIVDYSSPNVAKSLHIGHLRSTIIGESIVRMLKNAGNEVMGVNHIGDWGTQFGMIINYLKMKYINHDEIINYLYSDITNNDLMTIYRNAKQEFDIKDSDFADNSRKQTYYLQQGNEENKQIWKRICEISYSEYSKLYEMLNIKNLTECGESFYQQYIPQVLDILEHNGIIQIDNGAKMIKFENWSYPLIVVKSDGGYTYDTTDIAALYYRLCILNVDKIIYITDAGQKTHFDMCFDVAKSLRWCEGSQLIHIGFGLVLGKDGKKLKTRSGDVVKMIDVMNDVTHLSYDIIHQRAEGFKNNNNNIDLTELTEQTTSQYYKNITEEELNVMSKKIGMNTLKYFDLSHRYDSNYKFDDKKMFQFQGDTGVYLMYCYARINGIIERSTIGQMPLSSISDTLKADINKYVTQYMTKQTKGVIMQIVNYKDCIMTATNNHNPTEMTKYLYNLCTAFNSFVTQEGGKIAGTNFETFGIYICMNVSKIIKMMFELLSLEPVIHI